MLSQKLVLSYATKIVLQVIQMATSFIVARLVGPSVIGTLAYGLAFASMFSFLAELGTGAAHIKILSSGQIAQKVIVGTFARIKLVLSGFYSFVATGAFFYVKYLGSKGFESVAQEAVVLIYLMITIINQILTVYTVTWAARTEQAKQDIPDFLRTLLYQILRLLLAILGFKAVGLALGNLAAVIVILPVFLYLGRDIKIGPFDRNLFREYITISLPVILIGICQVLIFSVDKVYLQAQSSTEELGYYSAAFALSSFIKTLEASVGLLLFPYFSKQIALSDYTKINNTLVKYERFTLIFLFPLVMMATLIPDVLIRLTYGLQFMPTSPIFAILLFSYFLSLFYLPYANILFGQGFFKKSAIIWASTLAVFLVCAVLFVSNRFFNLKGVGMALSLLISNLTLFITMSLVVKYAAGNKIRVLPGIWVLVSVLLYFLTMHLLTSIFISESLIQKTVFSVVATGLFFLIGIITRIIKKGDILMVAELLNLKKLKGYIKSEIKNK